VQEFDNIYSKKIAKKYDKYELQHLSSKRKDVKEIKAGAGRPYCSSRFNTINLIQKILL